MFYRKWKIRNVVVLDVRSVAHLEAFLIKQDVLFFARLQRFRQVQRRARAIACLICRSLCYSFLPYEVGNKHEKQRGIIPPHPEIKVLPEKTRSELPSPDWWKTFYVAMGSKVVRGPRKLLNQIDTAWRT